ncbi:hypothetical protein BCV72DRAFT_229932 [Rhizopus microsporus var. microsporus]|uniref:Uncharacterized protein n=1 Tax=Rhizopus microsporus var. microsporus TaxID=86635 RepID=A0A1X0R035_RHIZD|nr:hypothetical protein BCV72DRAFT_229932 [Rhizopus microsporus var. microsporus]
MTTWMDKYPSSLVAKVKNKTEKGKPWFELSIVWGKFEMLLTGGICGNKLSNDVVPFLGLNMPLKELVDGDSFTSENIYVNCHDDGVKAYFQVRSLRNWIKLPSSFECACISSRFHRKDFATNEQYEVILKLFKALQTLKEWQYRDQIKASVTIKKRLVANKGSRDLIALAEYMCKNKEKERESAGADYSRQSCISLSKTTFIYSKTK